MSVRVVIADDQALIRTGLRGIVETADDLTVVGEAATGASAVDEVLRLEPDVVLMDIRMPELDGIAATQRLTATGCASRVLILTTFDLDEYVYGALRAGASGFLLKDAPPADLHAAIRVVAAGDALLAPKVTRRLIAAFTTGAVPGTPASPELDVLTARERQVLALVGEGLTNAEIGRRLFITPGTAKVHVARLLYKLGARDRVQLVIIANRAGLSPQA
ncbi:DNA-binding response regulator [Actinoplanes ianthinogenes]|uniref:DNA-binding response regulator n=1 Tax=Actinoplanes ianthinogenes TaxID=122358 RepID=A0ABM7M7M9_9ACTN|nr:response regulator transcription factor [Actinoplanes ianthinogenes]BCJ47616.1 DNA-binding response regulator [Actinoplanes ianthinogenes]GGR02954.1 DNA-binding response regulator [Actinoplanes ianthinogenes]